jgi:tetraacyldisaccharide 4'-kinase
MPVLRNPLRFILLYPLSLLYGFATSIRNTLYDLKIIKSHEFDLPIISIGNIRVGGTGKTPHVEYLVKLLNKNVSLATLSRGYKRKTSDFRMVHRDSSVAEVGDEPLQLKRKFPEIKVAVDNDRVHGISTLIEKNDQLNAVVLDDAFQHRKVKAGFSILLTDYHNLFTKDHLLPYGRLREKRYEKRRANIIIVTKCPENMNPMERRLVKKEIKHYPYQDLFFSTIKYGEPQAVFMDTNEWNNKKLAIEKPNVLLICGIAHPELFISHSKSVAKTVEPVIFSDHHNFKPPDIKKITSKFQHLPGPSVILTTEKDATRLREITNLPEDIKKHMYYIPIEVDFLESRKEKFDKLIFDYVKKNKRSGFIPQGAVS